MAIAPNTIVRRVPRVHAGGTHGATLVLKQTYRLEGQCYSRLLYIAAPQTPTAEKPQANGESTADPLGTPDNVFIRSLFWPHPEHYHDFAMTPSSLRVTLGDYELQGARGFASDGSFASAENERLLTGVTYELTATLNPDWLRVPLPAERITCSFRVDRIPRLQDPELAEFLEGEKIKVKVVHELNVGAPGAENWVPIDEEEQTATLKSGPDPVLRFTGGDGALVFDTVALNVPYVSQRVSVDEDNPEFHVFQHKGQLWAVGLNHLCITACVAMCQGYYGASVDDDGIRLILKLVEDAAKHYLDEYHHNRKTLKNENGPITLDANAAVSQTSRRNTVALAGELAGGGRRGQAAMRSMEKALDQCHVVLLTDGAASFWPHNLPVLLLPPVQKAGFHVELSDEKEDNLLTDPWPRPTRILGHAAPVIVGDDLSGDWEHARVCRGLVVNHEGKIVRAYSLNPSQQDELEMSTDGSQSDLGWFLVTRQLSQQDLSENELLAGAGESPAPPRDPAAAKAQTNAAKSDRSGH